MATKVYTDGSCLKNPGGAIGSAAVTGQGKWVISGEPSGTNQIAELKGIILALQYTKGDIEIYTDSAYSIGCATTWRKSWEASNYKNGTVKNLEYIKQIHELLDSSSRVVTFHKVKGHDTSKRYPLNDVADKLCGQASREAKKTQKSFTRSGATSRNSA